MRLETDTITADGTYSVTVLRGHRYVFSAAGTFGSGSLAIQWVDSAGNATAFPRSPATAATTWDFIAPTEQVNLVLSGATSPSIVVGIAPVPVVGDPVDNANVVGAIEDNPAAVVAALSKIEDYAGFELYLTAADNGKIYRCTAAADIVVTTPEEDPGVPFSVAFIQGHVGGAVVFNAAAGTTLQSYHDLNATAGIYAWASLIRVAANTYNLSGNLV